MKKREPVRPQSRGLVVFSQENHVGLGSCFWGKEVPDRVHHREQEDGLFLFRSSRWHCWNTHLLCIHKGVHAQFNSIVRSISYTTQCIGEDEWIKTKTSSIFAVISLSWTQQITHFKLLWDNSYKFTLWSRVCVFSVWRVWCGTHSRGAVALSGLSTGQYGWFLLQLFRLVRSPISNTYALTGKQKQNLKYDLVFSLTLKGFHNYIVFNYLWIYVRYCSLLGASHCFLHSILKWYLDYGIYKFEQ